MILVIYWWLCHSQQQKPVIHSRYILYIIIVLCWLMTSLLTGDAWSVGTTSSYVKYHSSWTEEKPSGKIRPFNSFPYQVNVRKKFSQFRQLYISRWKNKQFTEQIHLVYSSVEKPSDKYHGEDNTMEVAFSGNVNLVTWFSLYPWSWFKLCIFISSC